MVIFLFKKNVVSLQCSIKKQVNNQKKERKKYEQFERNFRSRREQEVYREW